MELIKSLPAPAGPANPCPHCKPFKMGRRGWDELPAKEAGLLGSPYVNLAGRYGYRYVDEDSRNDAIRRLREDCHWLDHLYMKQGPFCGDWIYYAEPHRHVLEYYAESILDDLGYLNGIGWDCFISLTEGRHNPGQSVCFKLSPAYPPGETVIDSTAGGMFLDLGGRRRSS
jgi:hypothetical protein